MNTNSKSERIMLDIKRYIGLVSRTCVSPLRKVHCQRRAMGLSESDPRAPQ
jgi:hypothetical protein